MTDAKDLFRWKRRTEPLVHHSDSRRAKDAPEAWAAQDEVEKWLKRVEAATEVAATRTFEDEIPDGAKTVPSSRLHRRFDNNVRFHEAKTETDFVEAQQLLDEWMTKNFINQIIGEDDDDDVDVDVDAFGYERPLSPTSPVLRSSVARAVSSNIALENLYDDIDTVDERDVVQNIMDNLLEAPIEENAARLKKDSQQKSKTASALWPKKKEAKKTGKVGFVGGSAMVKMLEEEEKHVDMKKRIVDRHEQVRQNRLLRERLLEEEREKRRQVREMRHEAEEMVAREAKVAQARRLAEEEEIKREMARIKREMEEKKAMEKDEEERRVEEEIKRAAEEEERRNREMEMTEKLKMEQAARERDRHLKLQKLDIRVRNSQLRTMRTHFTAWRTLIIDHRLQMGQARAIADWRLLMRTWAAWNGKYRTLWATQEGQKHLENMREAQRQQKKAEEFCKKRRMSKCLRSWVSWVSHQQMDRELQREKAETQKKMEEFLKACATKGKYDDDDDDDDNEDGDGRSFEENLNGIINSAKSNNRVKAKTNSLQPWQINKKHVYEGIDLKKDETTAAKPKTKSAFIVDAFQHRHSAQEKMLKTQQEMIKEQQRMLEEMRFLQSQQQMRPELQNIRVEGQAPATPQQQQQQQQPDSRTVSWSSPTQPSKPAKVNKFVKDMEERSKQRAERKAELERLKEQKQKEKIETQLRQEEEQRQREEEERQKKLEEVREKKRVEREQETEKQRKAEEGKRKQISAEEHDRRRLIKWHGFLAWKEILAVGSRYAAEAADFDRVGTMKKTIRAWALHVRETKADRERKAMLCQRRLLRRRCFLAWRWLKEDGLRLEVVARRHWAEKLTGRCLSRWLDFVQEERLARWERERTSKEHHERTLLRRAFEGWKRVPGIEKKERERENRKNFLRRKVADLLPDYQGTD